MVTDSQLIERLREILSESDLNTTTTAIVRRRLEADFCIDLSDRKPFVREQVDAYMQSQFENEEEAEDGINNEGEEAAASNDEKEEEEGEEQEEEEEEGDGKSNGARSRAKSSSKKRSRKIKEVKKRGGGGGFTKLCRLSPELEKFTGEPELPRTEVVKQLWNYIRENSLQNPSNKRQILCDDTLRSIFNVDTIDMFQMNKALTKHIWPLESDSASVSSATKEKQPKQEKDEDEDKSKKKAKRPRGSAFLAPVKLSDALIKFLGTGENELPRSDVVKRIWDYIKLNNLQDPSDKRQILCDEKLKELFNVETFTGFTVAKLLTSHLIKTEQ